MVALLLGCNGGGGGGGDGTDDDAGCPGGVCLPTENPDDGDGDGDGMDNPGDDNDGTGPDDGTADDGSTGTLPPDGVCDPSECDPWDINDPPDGNAHRACNDPDCDTTTALPDLDENFFRCEIMAVFQDGCANMGCHSPLTDARTLRLYARFQYREFPIHSGAQDEELLHSCASGFPQSATCERHPLTQLEWATNFDSARLFALDLDDPADSELLQQPLADDPGGLEHDAVDNWQSTSDVRYQTVLAWLGGATEQDGCVDIPTPPVVGSADNTIDGYFTFPCPDCDVGGGNCQPSGETPPYCDPNACVP